MLDLVFAIVGLLLTFPLTVAISIVVRLSSPGPALHKARRCGRNGEPFVLYKFRSMRLDAASSGPGITAAGDRRVTGVGRFLRSTKLDELPQLWNVLRGDMSIVGPRPEDPRYVDWYTAEQREILRWRPGITSPASVTYRNEESVLAAAENLDIAYRSVMAEKIRIDLGYFRSASLLGDLRWMYRTALAVIGSNRTAA
jgi:lipopolysaccharide/colanic/teichoic acid biosynthesis glycosyltransferase